MPKVSESRFEACPPFRYQDGRLWLGNRPLAEVAERLGTPFLLIDEGRLKQNYDAISAGLSAAGSGTRIRYCAKTNNESGILEVLARLGSGVLASYPEEVELALQSGFAPGRVAYQRPILLDHEVRAALDAGVRYFHAYRLTDLQVLDREAERLQASVSVSLRLRNAGGKIALSPLAFMSRRLGFAAGDILAAADYARRSPRLKLASINFYCGTQQGKPANFGPLLREAISLAAQIRKRYGIALEEINLGGGVPSQSLRRIGLSSLAARLSDTPGPAGGAASLQEFARALALQFREEARRAGLDPMPAVGLEPGRSMVGNAGFLVTRVIASEANWLFLDASRNYLPESLLMFSRRILPGALPEGGGMGYYHLSGNTLNTGDVVDLRRRLPRTAAGDLLVYCDAGAYSISRSSRYAGLSPAVHLLQEDGELRTIRRREELGDLKAPMTQAKERGFGAE